MTDWIHMQAGDGIVEITLNRPEKRNAIHWEMLQAIDAAFIEVERIPAGRVVLLNGEGPVFSAGIDLSTFLELPQRFGEAWPAHMLTITAAFQAILNRVERCSLPVIACLHGYCLGLGLELALACDLRLAAAGTMLGLPESRLGIIPDVGGTTRLARLIGVGRAKELIFTGRIIDADRAAALGIVNRVVPAEELRAQAGELAAEISASAPRAVTFAKRVIDGLTDLDRGLQLEAWAQSQLVQTEDFRAGVQAMLAKATPRWQGK